ncbi:MAG: NAD-dependent epimerase/dehydratase family protein [Burkholderiaceae bacterium]
MSAAPSSVLVLGATGGVGGHVARRLAAEGWSVRAMARRVPAASRSPSSGLARPQSASASASPSPSLPSPALPTSDDLIDWCVGDAMRESDVRRAAAGCEVIVHAVNPPSYLAWSRTVLPMLEHTIAAARASGATVVLPGTVYNFGPDAFDDPHEDAPQHPLARKGAIRVAMERRLAEASERGVPAIILRCGDFFGPRAGNNWLSHAMIPSDGQVRRIWRIGPANVGHQWAYLPDVAAALVRVLAERDRLGPFTRLHMAGHWDASGEDLARMIRDRIAADGHHPASIRAFPWWAIRIAAPVHRLSRELIEMRYLWRTPLRMDNARLRALIGTEPHTPLAPAIDATLIDLGIVSGVGGVPPGGGTIRNRPGPVRGSLSA